MRVGLSYEEFIKGISAIGYRWCPEDSSWRVGEEFIKDGVLRNFIASWPNLTVAALDLLRRYKQGFSVSLTTKPNRLIVTLGLPANAPDQKPVTATEQQVEMGRELHALVSSWQVGVTFDRAKKMLISSSPNKVIGGDWIRVATSLLNEHQQAVLQNRKLVQDGNDMLKSALAPEEPEE